MNKNKEQIKEIFGNFFKKWLNKEKKKNITSQPPMQPAVDEPTVQSKFPSRRKPREKQLTLPLNRTNKTQMSLPLDVPKKPDTYTQGTEFVKIAKALDKFYKTQAREEKKKKDLERLYRELKKRKKLGNPRTDDIELSELTSMIKENFDQEYGDGYTNDYQRAFAHSQTTTPRENATKKAKELAKQGKFVVLVEAPVYCKSTDACLGSSIVIHKVCNTREEAEGEQEKFNVAEHSDERVYIIGPDNLEPKQHKDTNSDDVPFQEGVGYVHDKDMKKDPKHIPGERWRIKFQSDSDLKKHGNTEMSSVKEGISKQDLKSVIKELVSEMWDSKNDVNGDEVHDKLNEASDWNPQPLPKDERQVSEIIHGLKEGTGVFFSYDNQTGHSSDWIWIECVSNGDAYTYYMSVSGNRGKVELDDDSMIDDVAKEVSKGGYHFFAIQSVQGYKKPAYYPQHPEDDQEVGEYEKYGADQPEPQYENKSHVNEVLGDYDAMIKFVQSLPAEEINKITVISQKLNIGAYDAIIEYLKQVQLQKKKGGKSQKNESGLSDPFAVQQQITNFITPRNVAKHVISKPIKNSATGEWVVKWMTNGKRDENKTYYTDDEQDAKLTAKQMMKHASQMNATGK